MGLKTVSQMCESLQISKRTLLEWVRIGRIPVIRVTPRTLRFDEEHVIHELRQLKNTVTTAVPPLPPSPAGPARQPRPHPPA
jgi:excisionase family DNA binding protein